ncbi:hypothetical protein GCM10026982_48580 [Nocardiopsis aegyptia]
MVARPCAERLDLAMVGDGWGFILIPFFGGRRRGAPGGSSTVKLAADPAAGPGRVDTRDGRDGRDTEASRPFRAQDSAPRRA